MGWGACLGGCVRWMGVHLGPNLGRAVDDDGDDNHPQSNPIAPRKKTPREAGHGIHRTHFHFCDHSEILGARGESIFIFGSTAITG